MRKRTPWQLHSSWPTSTRKRLATGPGTIDTQESRPTVVEQGRVAGIQLGLTCEDLVALGLQPSASLLTSGAVTDGRCSSGTQWPNAVRQLGQQARYSTIARPLHTPLDEESKGRFAAEYVVNMDQVACSVVWKQIVTISNLAIGGESDCVPNEAGRLSQLW